MKTNELRIGNYVNVDRVQNEILTIGEYACALKTKQGNNIASGIEFIKPIPLTEEWLIKFKYHKDTYSAYHIDCGNYVMDISINGFSGTLRNETSWWVSINTGYASQPMTIMIHHVHQLQNLYFALTGKELEIK